MSAEYTPLTTGDIDTVSLAHQGGELVVVKSFNPADSYGSARYEREKTLLAFLAEHTLSPQVLASDDEQLALTMEYIPHYPIDKIGATALAAHPDVTVSSDVRSRYLPLPTAVQQTTEAMSRLHALDYDPVRSVVDEGAILEKTKVQARVRMLAAAMASYLQNANSPHSLMPQDAAYLAEDISGAIGDTFTPTRKCLVHADLHILNVLIGANGARFIDLGKARIGDAAYDLAFFAARSPNPRFLDIGPRDSVSLLQTSIESYADVSHTPADQLAHAAWAYYLYDLVDQFSILDSMHLIRESSRPLFYRALDENLSTLQRLSRVDFNIEAAQEALS